MHPAITTHQNNLSDATRAVEALEAAVSPGALAVDLRVEARLASLAVDVKDHERVSKDDLRLRARREVNESMRTEALAAEAAVRELLWLGSHEAGRRPARLDTSLADAERAVRQHTLSALEPLQDVRREVAGLRLMQLFHGQPLARIWNAFEAAEQQRDLERAVVLEELVTFAIESDTDESTRFDYAKRLTALRDARVSDTDRKTLAELRDAHAALERRARGLSWKHEAVRRSGNAIAAA